MVALTHKSTVVKVEINLLGEASSNVDLKVVILLIRCNRESLELVR